MTPSPPPAASAQPEMTDEDDDGFVVVDVDPSTVSKQTVGHKRKEDEDTASDLDDLDDDLDDDDDEAMVQEPPMKKHEKSESSNEDISPLVVGPSSGSSSAMDIDSVVQPATVLPLDSVGEITCKLDNTAIRERPKSVGRRPRTRAAIVPDTESSVFGSPRSDASSSPASPSPVVDEPQSPPVEPAKKVALLGMALPALSTEDLFKTRRLFKKTAADGPPPVAPKPDKETSSRAFDFRSVLKPRTAAVQKPAQ